MNEGNPRGRVNRVSGPGHAPGGGAGSLPVEHNPRPERRGWLCGPNTRATSTGSAASSGAGRGQPVRAAGGPEPGCTSSQQDDQRCSLSHRQERPRGGQRDSRILEPRRECIFDIHITNTDARSYRNKGSPEPARTLTKQEAEKKHKYYSACQDQRKDFTPLVYSIDDMAGQET